LGEKPPYGEVFFEILTGAFYIRALPIFLPRGFYIFPLFYICGLFFGRALFLPLHGGLRDLKGPFHISLLLKRFFFKKISLFFKSPPKFSIFRWAPITKGILGESPKV